MSKYKKLVRDLIPDIIKAAGSKPITRKLSQSEYKKELLIKLVEEAKEVAATKNTAELIEEIADIQEVLLAIQEAFVVSTSEINICKKKKRAARGGFNKKLFLESVS